MRSRLRHLSFALVPAALALVLAACSGSGPDIVQAPSGGSQDATGDTTTSADLGPDPGAAADGGAGDIAVGEDVDSPDVILDFEPTPCVTNDDCPSGWCVEGRNGGICTTTCVQECPTGWTCQKSAEQTGADAQYLCVPLFGNLCRPCENDSDCGTFTGELAARCLDYGPSGHFCGSACATTADCLSGYECVSGQCTLGSGECTCTARFASEGAQTSCSNVNEVGSCDGTRLCAADGLTPCNAQTPVPESCNGLDDDCDGQTDEDLPDTDGDGTSDCAGLDDDKDGTPDTDDCAPFDPTIHPGATELCNGVDEDCDGQTDEPGADAGGPGAGTIGCGVGICEHTVSACADGCNPMDGATTEVCNGLDDDCDGLTDEEQNDDAGPGILPTSCGLGACYHVVPGCMDGLPTVCAPAANAGPEACNGLDDDCDGLTDETQDDAAGKGTGTITCGQGACQHALPACVDGQPSTCDSVSGTGELCNGLDDDCDGLTDEAADNGVPLTTCGVGACVHSVPACVSGQPATCDPLEGAASEQCNGVDDDCNGQTDDGLGSTTCGVGACQTTAPTCLGGQPNTCVAGSGGTELCNGFDDDCDGQTDEADAADCKVVYKDTDGDDYGGLLTACQCSPTTGYTTTGGDCNDAAPKIHPGAPDLCDDTFVDEDCDGYPDEGCYLASCKELRDQKGVKTSGVYSLDIDGIGGSFPSQVYCDMTTAGGAWTKVNGLAPELVTVLLGASGRQLLKCFTSDGPNKHIISPAFSTPWSWTRSSLAKVAGTWVVNGNNVTCGAEADYDVAMCSTFWGVGCSNGAGQSEKLIPGIVDSPAPKTCAAATSPDTPAAHTGGVFTICSGSNWNYWSIFVRAE